MAANNTLAVQNLDFTGIQQNLINFLKNYPQFKDYNFEGSNLRTLIDLLSYNTYMNSFYTNMAINEMFIDTATVRDSVISHAKELNYVPRSARSAEGLVDITIYPNNNPSYIIVPALTKFQGSNGNNVFTFLTTTSTIINSSNGNFVATQVPIFEGVMVTESFLVDNTITNQRFIISNPNIDTTSLTVSVTDQFGNFQPWEFHTSLLKVLTTTPAFYLQASGSNYELLFGDGIASLAPPNGSTIAATYRVCNQDLPNGITSFKAAQDIAGYSNYLVTTSLDSTGNPIPAVGGSQPESIDSIKFNAPRSFQSLDRAIVPDDYKNILFAQFPEIRALHVYGGETLTPPKFGKVFIVVDVNNALGISTAEADKIQGFIATKNSTGIIPVVVSPDYLFVKINSDVIYNLNATTKSPSDVKTEVINAINAYNEANLINFDTTLRYSKLAAQIDASESSLTSVNTRLQVFRNIIPDLNTNFSVEVDFQNSLTPLNIQSTGFTFGSQQNCSFADDGFGNINIVSTAQGIASIIVPKIGTIDYVNGIIKITNFNISAFVGDFISIYSSTTSTDISCRQNTILEIDLSQVNINVTGTRS